jgi:hypothetical protein
MVDVHVCHVTPPHRRLRLRPANSIFDYFGDTVGVIVDDGPRVRVSVSIYGLVSRDMSHDMASSDVFVEHVDVGMAVWVSLSLFLGTSVLCPYS